MHVAAQEHVHGNAQLLAALAEARRENRALQQQLDAARSQLGARDRRVGTALPWRRLHGSKDACYAAEMQG